jgi:hypothetical protein
LKRFLGLSRSFALAPSARWLRRDLPLTRYDRSTFYGGDRRGYIDYPAHADTAPAAV